MKRNFCERPEHMRPNEVEWQKPKQLMDEDGQIWCCLPVGCESQMFDIVHCRGGCGQPPYWIGVGSPFNDGQQYLLSSEAWCYWCLPREHFSEEELRVVRREEWARKQTVDEIVEIIRRGSFGLDNKEVEEAMWDLASTIQDATESREEKLRLRAEWGQLVGAIHRANSTSATE
jgi:hypothetical protein